MEFTKTERRLLRELAAEVYEAEAGQLLEELESEFKRWRDSEIPASRSRCSPSLRCRRPCMQGSSR